MRKNGICKWYNLCPLKRFYERGMLDERWIKDYCWGNYSACIRKKMEEEGVFHSDNMMPEGTIDVNLR